MIAKIITGTNTKALLQYLTAKKNEIISLNKIFPGLTVNEIAKEIEMIQALNNRCKKNLMHVILSFPYKENLDNLKMKTITEDFLYAFKTKDYMSISYRHFDRNHPHVHCVINKIKEDGSVLSDSFSHIRAKKICRKLEQVYQLEKVSSFKNENDNIAINELQNEIDNAIYVSHSLEEMIRILLSKKYKTKKGRGIVFINKENGTKIKGSAIGRNYSLLNIEKRILQKGKKIESEMNDIQQIIEIKFPKPKANKNQLKL